MPQLSSARKEIQALKDELSSLRHAHKLFISLSAFYISVNHKSVFDSLDFVYVIWSEYKNPNTDP
jgi:hypothetical protein